MQRTMFSGGSIPSISAHRRKNRHGKSSYSRRHHPTSDQRQFVSLYMETIQRTLSHTKIRFQKPSIDSCAGVIPLHARVSLIAITCMTWIRVSIVKNEIRKRSAYRAVARGTISVGRASWTYKYERKSNRRREWLMTTCHIKSLKVIMGPAMYSGA